MQNILFVCNQNRYRSPTAEAIFKDKEGWSVKSAGLYCDPEDGKPLNKRLLKWADIIFVIEQSQKVDIQARWPDLAWKHIVVLDIPDHFEYMQPELVKMLKEKVINNGVIPQSPQAGQPHGGA